ncbi:MAG: hypothetical protein ACOYOB_17370, partial [Myxococcota bacterium]
MTTQTPPLVVAPAPSLPAPYETTLSHLRQLNRTAYLAYALEVGRYMIDTWFDGDIRIYRDRRSPEHLPFEALLRDCRDDLVDLNLSPSTLRNYMLANAVWRELPESVRTRLDLTHLHSLAGVPDSITRVRLAHDAAELGWPTRELDRAIENALRPPERVVPRGRPKLPPPVKAWHHVSAAARKAEELHG